MLTYFVCGGIFRSNCPLERSQRKHSLNAAGHRRVGTTTDRKIVINTLQLYRTFSNSYALN